MQNGNADHLSVQIDGNYLTLKAAARQWPGSPRYEQVWRWAQRGLPLVDGTLRLRTIRTNRIVTRLEWIQDFITEMNVAYQSGRVLSRRPRQRHSRADRPQVLSHADAVARSGK